MAYTGVRADSSAADLCIPRNTPIQEKRNLKVILTFRTILEVFWCSDSVFEKKNHDRLTICIAVFPVHQAWSQWMEPG